MPGEGTVPPATERAAGGGGDSGAWAAGEAVEAIGADSVVSASGTSGVGAAAGGTGGAFASAASGAQPDKKAIPIPRPRPTTIPTFTKALLSRHVCCRRTARDPSGGESAINPEAGLRRYFGSGGRRSAGRQYRATARFGRKLAQSCVIGEVVLDRRVIEIYSIEPGRLREVSSQSVNQRQGLPLLW